MKSKIINLSLIGAFILGSASTFVSCKDTESDELANLQSQVNGLHQDLQTQIADLQAQHDALKSGYQTLYNDLKDKIDAIKSCDCVPGQSQLPDFLQGVTTTDQLAEKLIQSAGVNSDVYKKTVEPWISAVLADQKVATKDDVASALTSYLWVLDYKDQITELESTLNASKKLAQDAATAAAEAQQNADSALEKANALTDSIAKLMPSNEYLSKTVANLLDRIAALEEKSGNNTACTCPSWLPDSITNVAVLAQEASNTASQALADAQKLNDKTKAYVDSVANKAAQDLTIYSTKAEVEQKFNDAYAEFKDSINGLRDTIAKLVGQYELILGKYNSLVTGVSVEASTNHVFGSLNLPGINATILAAYYGTLEETQFPTKRSKYFATADEAAAFSDLTFSGDTYASGTVAVQNPGDLYVTVNPNDVDFSNISISLVNSQDQKAGGYYLGALEKTDKVLTFGYSRAADNGFYVTHAGITSPSEVAKFSVDKSALKSSASSILSDLKSGSYFSSAKDLVSVATTLFKGVNNQLPAYAVKATWNDGEKNRSVTSHYSVAATAIPALSYKFGQSLNTNISLPRVPSFQTILNNFGLDFSNLNFDFDFSSMFGGDSIVISVPLNMIFDVELNTDDVKPDVTVDVDYSNIEVEATITGSPSLNKDAITAVIIDKDGKQEVEITVSDKAINMDGVGVTVTKFDGIQVNPHVNIDFSKIKLALNAADAVDPNKSQFILNKNVDVVISADMLKQMLNVESLNTMLSDKLSFLTDLTSKLDGSALDTYINKINTFLGKIENLFQNANSFLQPALFYTNGSSFDQLSTMANMPTTISLSDGEASKVLYASSYTGEIIVPAYKKYVAIYKKDASGSWVPYTTGNDAQYKTGEVIDGDVVKVGFHATETGLYRVVYQALDYNGKVAGRNYYIQVK
jgi:hypothetical protein